MDVTKLLGSLNESEFNELLHGLKSLGYSTFFSRKMYEEKVSIRDALKEPSVPMKIKKAIREFTDFYEFVQDIPFYDLNKFSGVGIGFFEIYLNVFYHKKIILRETAYRIMKESNYFSYDCKERFLKDVPVLESCHNKIFLYDYNNVINWIDHYIKK